MSSELSKRKHEVDVPSSISPPPGSMIELHCPIDENAIKGGRLYFDQEFTRKLLSDCLGLPSGIRTSLSFAIISPGEDPKPAKLRFYDSSHRGCYLKVGVSFLEQLNLQPGSVLTMKYLYWQRSGGGKDGTDPLYCFSLDGVESTRPSYTTDGMDDSYSPTADDELREQTYSEQPRKHQRLRNQVEKCYYESEEEEALPGPTAGMSTKAQHSPSVSQEIKALIPPQPDQTTLFLHTVTAGFDTANLTLSQMTFFKPFFEDTLGIAYTKERSLSACLVIQAEGGQTRIEPVKLSPKYGYLSRWKKIRELLGGVIFGDELLFTYLGHTNVGSETVSYFSLKKQSNGISGDDVEDEIAAAPRQSDSFDMFLQGFEERTEKKETAIVDTSSARKKENHAVQSNRLSRHAVPALVARAHGDVPRPPSPSLVQTEPDEEVDRAVGEAENEEVLPLSQRRLLLMRPAVNRELKTWEPPSVLQVCADELSSLESFMNSVRARARTAPAPNISKEKNVLRYRLAKHCIDSGIAERNPQFSGNKGVYYDKNSHVFSQFVYKENSNWAGPYIPSLKSDLIQELRGHGASISPSLESVLRNQWSFDVWMGTLNDRTLLPGNVGVVALENIPAGSFVCQFIGEYISWSELPAAGPDMYDAYLEEQAELDLMSDEEEQEDLRDGVIAKSSPDLWLGNISKNCTELALNDVFSQFGNILSVRIIRPKGRPSAFVNFTDIAAAEAAFYELNESVIPSITGNKPLVIKFKRDFDPNKGSTVEEPGNSGGGASGDKSIYNDLYYRNLHSQAEKCYRCHILEECVVPFDAALRDREDIVERAAAPSGRNAAINNSQWIRLETTILDAKKYGHATRFMRRSEDIFNLARVELHVPNGPTKVLYYAKRDIVRGEELIREP